MNKSHGSHHHAKFLFIQNVITGCEGGGKTPRLRPFYVLPALSKALQSILCFMSFFILQSHPKLYSQFSIKSTGNSHISVLMGQAVVIEYMYTQDNHKIHCKTTQNCIVVLHGTYP